MCWKPLSFLTSKGRDQPTKPCKEHLAPHPLPSPCLGGTSTPIQPPARGFPALSSALPCCKRLPGVQAAAAGGSPVMVFSPEHDPSQENPPSDGLNHPGPQPAAPAGLAPKAQISPRKRARLPRSGMFFLTVTPNISPASLLITGKTAVKWAAWRARAVRGRWGRGAGPQQQSVPAPSPCPKPTRPHSHHLLVPKPSTPSPPASSQGNGTPPRNFSPSFSSH